MFKMHGPAGRTSWTDQLDGPAGQTSSFYLKSWPVRIFEDFCLSLYIVAASEFDEGLVLIMHKHFAHLPLYQQTPYQQFQMNIHLACLRFGQSNSLGID